MALHGAEDYGEAINALETMLSFIEKSPDEQIRRTGFFHYLDRTHYDIAQGYEQTILLRARRSPRSMPSFPGSPGSVHVSLLML